MIDLDEVLLLLGQNILPSGIQLVLVLTALVGMIIIFSSMARLYTALSDNTGMVGDGPRVNGLLVRVLLGGLMTVPTVILWQSADALLAGGTQTNSAVLAYIAGPGETPTYCTRFKQVITLAFMLVGVIAMYVAFQNADDQARGFSPNGYRVAIPYFIGGLGCFFILDIVEVVSNTIGVDAGFDSLCTALGS